MATVRLISSALVRRQLMVILARRRLAVSRRRRPSRTAALHGTWPSPTTTFTPPKHDLTPPKRTFTSATYGLSPSLRPRPRRLVSVVMVLVLLLQFEIDDLCVFIVVTVPRFDYSRQGTVTCAKAELTLYLVDYTVSNQCNLSVILSARRIAAKVVSGQPLSLKVNVGPTSRQHRLTDGDPEPDTDSRSLFNFPHHCGKQIDLRRFTGVSHTVTSRFSRHSAKWLTPTR